jgi:regulator of replication initiation timing
LNKVTNANNNNTKKKETKKDVEKKLLDKIQEIEVQRSELEILEWENSRLKDENKELKEALRQQVKTNFVSASQIPNPQSVWIAAINCGSLSKVLNNIWVKLTGEQEKGKILFDIGEDGSIKNPRPE